jgi:hypothetical protein
LIFKQTINHNNNKIHNLFVVGRQREKEGNEREREK